MGGCTNDIRWVSGCHLEVMSINSKNIKRQRQRQQQLQDNDNDNNMRGGERLCRLAEVQRSKFKSKTCKDKDI